MTYNPYEILGVESTFSMEKITEEFLKQKRELTKSILTEGEEGNLAAEKLQQIKDAYEEIKYLLGADAKSDSETDKRPLGKIEELIKKNELVEAQKLLDAQVERGAEWHYIQAALYYKQGWVMESKKQLDLAVQQAPYEEKYKKARESLMNVITFGNPDGLGGDSGNNNRSYPPNNEYNPAGGLSCCNICGTLLIADCCCDCLCR